MTQPQLQQATDQPPRETVLVEMAVTPAGRAIFNVQGAHLQAPPDALWERIIVILQGGLRAAIVQTVAAPPEPSRLVTPGAPWAALGARRVLTE
jgi:hypothetical protein